MIVDTHTHVVSSDEERYPLQCTTTDPADPSSWPVHARITAVELSREMAECEVERACLVQGFAAYQYNNSYTIDAAENDPARFVSVCVVDTADPESPTQLERLTSHSRMRGVRLVTGFMEGDPGLDSPEAQNIWDAADDLGIVVVAFTLGEQLETLASAAHAHRERPVVLDHCGFVDVSQDFQRLAALAPLDNLVLKVSTRVLVQDEPAGIVRQLADRFGAERLMWGSDYPASHQRSYRDWVQLAQASTSQLSSEESEHFLGRTALRLWPELA